MKRKQHRFIFLLLIISSVFSFAQQKYVNIDLGLVAKNFNLESTGNQGYQFNSENPYIEDFFFELFNISRAKYNDQLEAIELTVKDGDLVRNQNSNSTRAEMGFNKLSKTGKTYLKLQFYLDESMNINSNGKSSIFQIIPSATKFKDNDEYKCSPLPSFMIYFMHNLSDQSKAVIKISQGLLFGVKEEYLDPDRGSNSKNYRVGLDNNYRVDMTNQRYGNEYFRKGVLKNLNYGWHELLLEINWSKNSQGYYDVSIDNEHIQHQDYTTHSFEGPTIYDESMIPKGTSFGESGLIYHSLKFGHYRYNISNECKIYFKEFYIDSEPIGDNLTKLLPEYEGKIINGFDEIESIPVKGADSYVFFFKNVTTKEEFYSGSSSNKLALKKVFENNDSFSFGDYRSYTRVNKSDGLYKGEYGSITNITIEAKSKLISSDCNKDFNGTENMSCQYVNGATSYVFLFTNNQTNEQYYFGSPDTTINLEDVYQNNPNMKLNQEYRVRVRPRNVGVFEGEYGDICYINLNATSKLISSDCNKDFNGTENMSCQYVNGATSYVFLFTNNQTNEQYYFGSSNTTINLEDVYKNNPNMELNQEYRVRVRPRSMGIFDGEYGGICYPKLYQELFYKSSIEDSKKISSSNTDILLSPNPTIRSVRVINNLNTIPLKLEIFSSSNQLIYSNNTYTGESISLENNPPGMYFVKAYIDGVLNTKKLILK